MRRKSSVKVTQSCLTLGDPMDYTVHGILQARILERIAFSFSRGSSQPRGFSRQEDSSWVPLPSPSIYLPSIYLTTHWGFPDGSTGKESACSVGDLGSIPGLGGPPGGGNGYPLDYSGQGSSMDCIVHGVAKSRTRLSDFHFLSISFIQI